MHSQFLLFPMGWIVGLGLCMLHVSADGHHYTSLSQQGDEGIMGVQGPVGMMVSVNVAQR